MNLLNLKLLVEYVSVPCSKKLVRDNEAWWISAWLSCFAIYPRHGFFGEVNFRFACRLVNDKLGL